MGQALCCSVLGFNVIFQTVMATDTMHSSAGVPGSGATVADPLGFNRSGSLHGLQVSAVVQIFASQRLQTIESLQSIGAVVTVLSVCPVQGVQRLATGR
jgi:hypothetical protein